MYTYTILAHVLSHWSLQVPAGAHAAEKQLTSLRSSNAGALDKLPNAATILGGHVQDFKKKLPEVATTAPSSMLLGTHPRKLGICRVVRDAALGAGPW